MTTSSHHISIEAPKTEVFEALTTVEGLMGWYTPQVTGEGAEGGTLTMAFAKHEGPFEWKVTQAKSDVVRWECKKGPGEAVGTTVTFQLRQRGPNDTIVDFDHYGFKDDEKLRVCNSLWGALAHQLKKYVQSRQPQPVFA